MENKNRDDNMKKTFGQGKIQPQAEPVGFNFTVFLTALSFLFKPWRWVWRNFGYTERRAVGV